MTLPEAVQELGAAQLGVVARRQLVEAGVPAGLIRWHTAQRWRSLLPGVLMLNTGLPTPEQRMMAALLYAGPDSWLGGQTAAQALGLVEPGPDLPIHVYVPHPQRSRRVAWVRIRATRLTNERLVERGPLRLSCRPRALVDAAADAADERAARHLIVAAVQDRLVRLDDVQHWVGARRRNGTVRLKRAVAEAAAGSWSVPEADLAALLGRSPMLPELLANPSLQDAAGRPLTTPDLWVDEVALAIMVHSKRYHAGALDWDATVMADEDLRAAGVEVVPVTPTAIERRPAEVLERVLAAHRRASARPRPAVSATPKDYLHQTG